MDNLTDYNEAKKLSNFGVPLNCPNCNKQWKPEPPPLIIMQEGFFGGKQMAQKYYKTCEFCGHTYGYYG